MFKKLKSLFVVEEDVPDIEKQMENAVNKKAKKADPAPKVPTAAIEEITEEIFTSNVSGPAKPAKKFTDILIKAIEKENLEGADYLEFKSSLKSLENVIDDEETRYKSSFAVLNTDKNFNKEKLLQTGEHYISVLKREQAKFDETFKAQQSKQIQTRETKIKSYSESIAKKKESLKKLIQDIELMEKKLDEAKIEINQAAGKVQLTKDQFMASYILISEQMQQDFQKIKQYL